jgi:RNA polymerase sigma-70 factor (ECF subfamily)
MRALSDLPPEQRMIIVMHYLEDKPLKQISRITRVPVGTLKSRLFTARNSLAAALKPGEQQRSKP